MAATVSARYKFKCALACPNGFESNEMPAHPPTCSIHRVAMVQLPSPLEEQLADVVKRIEALEKKVGMRQRDLEPSK